MTENGNNGMVMPVTPFYGSNGGGNGGFGFGGDGGWLFLILLIALCGGGFGNGFGGAFGGGNIGGDLYPWINQSNQINDGFRDQMINDNVTEIRSGVNGLANQLCSCCGDISTQLCNGFNGVTSAVNGAQNALAQQMYGNTIADMQRSFALQNGISDVKFTVATENCADRTQSMINTRDIIDSQTRGIQTIMDKLCALELDSVRNQLAQAQRENTGLQNALNMANLAASQTQQTVNIRDSIIDELRSCPIPSQPVYGSQPIFTCPNNNNGCGCGCNNF